MTNKRRKAAAFRLRELLDRGMLRKLALAQVRREYSIGRSTIYRYCAEFSVGTK